MKTVAFATLGCKVNTYETEVVARSFEKKGYKRVDFTDIADIYVINTCTVTNTSDSKSRKIIRQSIRKNPDAIVVVMGCFAQINPDVLDSMPGVDIVVGNNYKNKVLDLVEEYIKRGKKIIATCDIRSICEFEDMSVDSYVENKRAFVKIQDGCDNFCSYCIIPWVRGRVRSKDPKKVIEEIKNLVLNGHIEVVLTGIHTGHYGSDLKDYTLAKLIKEIIKEVPNLKRLRISSIEMNEVTSELIEVTKASEKIVKHLHIPLQSGCDETLRRMNRKYTTFEFKNKIKELRKEFSDIAITTDVIVGFPGETEEEFLKTYNFIKEMEFFTLHVFPFSKREKTKAAGMKEQVPYEIKKARVKKLIELNNELALKYIKKFEGKTLQVIPEVLENNYLVGHSDNYIKIKFLGDLSLINKVVNVQVIKASYPVSVGKLIEK